MNDHDDIEKQREEDGEILLDLTQPLPAPPKKRHPVLWLTLFVLLGAAGFAGYVGYMFLTVPPQTPGSERIVLIPSGASGRKIAEILATESVIRDKTLFMLLARFYRSGKTMKAGEYQFTTAMLPTDVLTMLQDGKVYARFITIPEGYTARQMADVLAEHQLDKAAFLAFVFDKQNAARFNIAADTLEGYLFPSTYHITRETTAEALAQMMVEEFWKVMTPDLRQEIAQQGMTVHEIVTLASIVEEEARLPEERELIAAVYRNRLRIGMKLDSDPTVIYGIPNFNGNLTRTDLQTDTPYNTYMRKGLPPGPIASPGKASILAAIRPANVKYLYFVAKNDGSHQFSTNYQDHLRAVQQYQRNRKKAAAN
ncbi:hypothetical protein U14_04826 [Candidatus Moduliflexus flocculans]|uniref:Endolytic murein transglycosylase n=1 Tax=Candidatus Moduliflexus flocculans TaxID=1499966 RepID=A0A0S6W183_9BACT|nr:hypothetical protein U14_04826 [Candidatus Moduliflexus flocculans]